MRLVPRPSALGARDRRAIRLGVWVVVPVLLATLVVQPYARAVAAARGGVATQRALLARELGVLRDVPAVAVLARDREMELAGRAGRLFDGGSAVAASAELASYVADRAAESGLEITASETLTPAEDDSTVAAEIRALGDIAAIFDFLRALEEGERLVRAERISIAGSADGAALDRDGLLTVAARVSGLVRDAYVDESIVGRRDAPTEAP